MAAIDVRWFREDRKLPKGKERDEAIAESKKALANATLLNRRLKVILEEEIEKTYVSEESTSVDNYAQLVLASSARRKAFKDIIKLLP